MTHVTVSTRMRVFALLALSASSALPASERILLPSLGAISSASSKRRARPWSGPRRDFRWWCELDEALAVADRATVEADAITARIAAGAAAAADLAAARADAERRQERAAYLGLRAFELGETSHSESLVARRTAHGARRCSDGSPRVPQHWTRGALMR